MTPLYKKIDMLSFTVYSFSDELPYYIDDIYELMKFTGLRKKDIVYKINHSISNWITVVLNKKMYTIYYFL